jgi:homoserine dehydrogenase
MRLGKHVVTANKKMLALHMTELLALQQETGVHLLYEASACGSIPIIRNLEEYYDNELLQQISGIFNGSSNYILTKVCLEGEAYDQALAKAQALGFAESDPTLDVAGFDALYKLVILTLHAFGQVLDPSHVFNAGIQHLHKADQTFAAEKGWRIKLLCQAVRIGEDEMTALVMPAFIESTNLLYNVNNEYNAVAVQAAFADQQFFQGKGAGGNPTGAAVLSDISALTYGYAYEYKKMHQALQLHYTDQVLLHVYLGYEDEAMLAHFDFWDVDSRHQGKDHNYIIGRVKLADLVRIKEKLVHLPVFLALMPGAQPIALK